MLPEDEPERGQVARELALRLADVATKRQARKSGLLIQQINEAYKRMLKSDVKYRFVIDMASL